jgi:hypothetical protein
MRIKTLTLAALAWATLGVAGALAGYGNFIALPPPPAGEAPKAPAAVNDPAEPLLQVEMTSSAGNFRRGGGGGQKVEVASSARGTTLKVPTSGGYNGTADLTFKNGAPPMRFTTRLTGMQNYDLQSLSITSGSLTLQIGQVGTSATTKYFNAKGQVQQGATGAAYTVTARRCDNG